MRRATPGSRVAAGHYRLSVLDLPDDSAVFNGTIEQVDLVGEGTRTSTWR